MGFMREGLPKAALVSVLAVTGCASGPNNVDTPDRSPSPRVSTQELRIGACATEGVRVILEGSEAEPSADACQFGSDTRAEFIKADKGQVGKARIAESNGWFLKHDRSVCVFWPVVGSVGERGFFAYVESPKSPVVTVDSMTDGAPLPENVPYHDVTIGIEGGKYVARGLEVAGKPRLDAVIGERLDGGYNCK